MNFSSLGRDIRDFLFCLGRYAKNKALFFVSLVSQAKSWLASRLYWQRGKLARPFTHSGMALLVIGGITLGPILISENFPGLTANPWQETLPPSSVLATALSGTMETSTLESIKPRSEAVEYTVVEGDTISTVAEKFGISVDTIRWENNLSSIKITPGQILRILPVTGVLHKVKYGETIYTIADKYQANPQAIVDWPYNSFANDETFALAAGQTLIIPDGIMPREAPAAPRYYAQVPGAGTVTGTGQFAWPTSGVISQGFSWYHRGIDIANANGPEVLAADGGTIIVAGWPDNVGYGNRVMIDHGNNFVTLYGHLALIYVSVGQRVQRGQPIGKMGSTGRSTGTHTHFEIRLNGVTQNPLNYLK